VEHAAGTSLEGKSKWLAIAGVGMGVFMATLDSSIVNISLPTLVSELDATFATIEWVILSYTLVVTSLLLVMARLGDMVDKKRLYMIGLALFTIASLLCGLAPSVGWLIAFRALQGLGAAFTQALGTAIIAEVIPSSERGRALGIMGSTVSTGIAVGPPLGGLLIGMFGWRAIFLVNLPVGLAAIWVVSRFVPSSTTRPGQRFDPAGAAVLFFTLALYAIGMTLGQQDGFHLTSTRTMLGLAVVGLIGFIYLETRVKQPMVDLRMFRNSLFSLNLLMAVLVFITMAGMFIMPFFLQLVKGFSTAQVGLMMIANPLTMGIVAPIAGSLSDRFGSRSISLIGLLMIIGGCFGIATLSVDTTAMGFVLRLIPFGAGMGMFQSPNNNAIMGSVPRDRLGVASGLLALSRTFGNTTGLPLMGALYTSLVLAAANLPAGNEVTAAPAYALVNGINGTYRTAAFFIIGAVVLATAALWIDARRRRAERAEPQVS
jgi:EmrB/QacA subfamily drug resistance transporter